MASCGVCRKPLPREPEKIFRLSRKQGKKLSKESLSIQKWIGRSALCESCAVECRKAGLRLASVADIRQWSQKKAADKIINLISQAEAEALNGLKLKLEAERSEQK